MHFAQLMLTDFTLARSNMVITAIVSIDFSKRFTYYFVRRTIWVYNSKIGRTDR